MSVASHKVWRPRLSSMISPLGLCLGAQHPARDAITQSSPETTDHASAASTCLPAGILGCMHLLSQDFLVVFLLCVHSTNPWLQEAAEKSSKTQVLQEDSHVLPSSLCMYSRLSAFSLSATTSTTPRAAPGAGGARLCEVSKEVLYTEVHGALQATRRYRNARRTAAAGKSHGHRLPIAGASGL